MSSRNRLIFGRSGVLEARDFEGTTKANSTFTSLGHVTRARMSQIRALVNLAPEIIEAWLFLLPIEHGRDPIVLREVLPIAVEVDWTKQRRMWKDLE